MEAKELSKKSLNVDPSKSSDSEQTSTNANSDAGKVKREASWPSVLFYIHLNILGLYGIFVLLTNTSFLTILFTLVLSLLGIMGVTAGAHRLWAHKTYEATFSLKVFLMICQTLAGTGSIYNWTRAHRLHHQKFRTTDDPFYSSADFFSAQVRAQIESLTPEQEKLLEQVDMSDLEEDNVVMFQKKFYWILYFIVHVLLPINAPLEYWGDTIPAAIFVTFSLRYLIVLNVCWLINSAHFVWGLNKNFKPSDSNMIFIITKSYWPQYHYLLPCDYQTGEFGDYAEGCTTLLIRVFAALGMATQLQTITTEAVRKGLTTAVESGKSIVECIKEAAVVEQAKLPEDHYLDKSKFLTYLKQAAGSSFDGKFERRTYD
ncbi:acyl-CoA Delta-9 desaturase [Episyrphus balteatus]|uniref:acyl-CoA Delta-9 desaturase n=1 Tax=Episyrphus balteatus TaxID=286459 RepID=UPI0024860CDC|nr:acyl-CoA Delta-9 desaturase [Episyrphus balteatus]